MWRRRWVGLARWGGAVRCGAVGGRWGRGGGVGEGRVGGGVSVDTVPAAGSVIGFTCG